MDNDTQFLLIILIISFVTFMYMQYYCQNDNKTAQIPENALENFFVESTEPTSGTSDQSNGQSNGQLNGQSNGQNSELDTNISDNNSDNSTFSNPQDSNIITNNGNSSELQRLIQEVNSGNTLLVNSPEAELYRQKAKSINAANNYRKISYKDSEYRTNFDGMPSNQNDMNELNKMYDNALVFKNSEYSTNNNFTGFSDNNNWGPADLSKFGANGPETQQQKVLSLYNVNEYLPNKDYTNKKMEDGFQILDNPISVSNPNLIPVLKSIPISTTSGSTGKKVGSYNDLRPLPPCPKTVVSPFLNSSVMPDIYATQRGCL